ncbi:MAG TPA: DUF3300 domain-containing protein [Bryobacteraceae bacterium]|nr:DUF3300 domain-containing protein [Bryobacteraceae bacterium]
MRKTLFVPFVLLLACALPAWCQDDANGYFSPEQLDNLLAPIALYPDPLLAQVLVAATFPDQIDEASRFVRANTDPGYIDEEPWDVSVKAVAHYPTVLFNMADKLDWTTALGQAYVSQSADVMTAVQRLRVEARSAGNLMTTPQQEVREDGGYIAIWPAQPQYIYVPVYDPALIYYRQPGFYMGLSFGRGFFIGAWLNNDFDWRYHRVYYHGWDDHYGTGWMVRSRSYVHINNVYVNVNFRNVVVNRTVVNREVNYNTLERYHSVHRDTHFDNVRGHDRDRALYNDNHPVQNKIIDRNINTNDQRIDTYRGRPQQGWRSEDRPPVNNPPPPNRPEVRPAERDNSAFGGNHGGGFDPHAASQRGQDSRNEARRPAPESRPAPPPKPAPHHDDDKDRRK